MTIIFQDGFETNDFTQWTNTELGGAGSAAAVETLNPYLGSYNGKFSTSTAGAEATVYKTIAGTAVIYLRAYVKFDALPAVGNLFYFNSIDSALPSAGTGTTAVLLNNGAGQVFWRLFDNGVEANEAAASNPVAGKYYCIEILRDKTNSIQKLWVDGVLKVTLNQAVANNSTTIAVGMDYNNSGGDASNLYIDAAVIADSYTGPLDIIRTEPLQHIDKLTLVLTTGGGGTNYTRAIKEVSPFIDDNNLASQRTFNRFSKDAFQLTENTTGTYIITNYIKSLQETMQFIDLASRTRIGGTNYSRILLETTLLIDSITEQHQSNYSRNILDSFQLVDKNSVLHLSYYLRSMVEAIVFVDDTNQALQRNFAKNILETEQYVETASHSQQYNFSRSELEAFELADTARTSTSLNYSRTMLETAMLIFSGAFLSTNYWTVAKFMDTFTFADRLNEQARHVFTKSELEAFEFTDILARSPITNISKTLIETLTLTDVLTEKGTFNYMRSMVDVLSFVDKISALHISYYTRSMVENATLMDDVNQLLQRTFSKTMLDVGQHIERLSHSQQYNYTRNMAENTTLIDDVNQFLQRTFSKTMADPGQYVERLSHSQQYNFTRNILDLLQLVDKLRMPTVTPQIYTYAAAEAFVLTDKLVQTYFEGCLDYDYLVATFKELTMLAGGKSIARETELFYDP